MTDVRTELCHPVVAWGNSGSISGLILIGGLPETSLRAVFFFRRLSVVALNSPLACFNFLFFSGVNKQLLTIPSIACLWLRDSEDA